MFGLHLLTICYFWRFY